MTPFIVTSDAERTAALERIELLGRFPPGSPEALERLALIEAIKIFDDADTGAAGWLDENDPP